MPSDPRILTPEQVAEICAERDRHAMVTEKCLRCAETHDEECSNCGGVGAVQVQIQIPLLDEIDALLASHAALRAERDALAEEARCFDALAESLGIDSTDDRFWIDANTKDAHALMEAVKARVAALEDAERIAWALAHVGFDIPCYITWSRAASEWRLTTPFTDADRAAGLMGNVRYHWLGSGKAPRLTPDARAAIDAARKENNGG